MSDSHANSVRPPSPDLAALAATLQETAQTLLALGASIPPGEAFRETTAEPAAGPPARPCSCPPVSPASRPVSRHTDGETRSFYFPPATVHQERELLRKYRAEDFQGLLTEVHTLLVGLVKVMRSVHKDVRVKGYVIASLGAQIDHASALVLRMRNVYENVMPVHR